ncbi:MAG: glycosyltransferase family 2 protein [Bacilli bacterium]|nr:glycosyltransferase family 2 protein [Bacilli bacterium]
MIKFSIIIPVYNTSIYLRKCLDSVLNQSYKNFEIIVINDGSTDNSLEIISEYNDSVKLINIDIKKDIGPSNVRNIGVKEATGDYILFLDSDDYYENDLLKVLSDSIDKGFDFVRFQIQYIKNGNVLKTTYNGNCTFNSGVDSFNYICSNSIVESPCCYAFRRKYWIENNFKFRLNTLHEDFGLIPLVIIKSHNSKYLDYVGYNYVQHENSIMSSNDYGKIQKKAFDFLKHFEYLKDNTLNVDGDLSVFNSYIANSVILKATTLKYNDYKFYIRKLKSNGAFDMLLCDTIGRKIKRVLIKISPKIYYKMVRR